MSPANIRRYYENKYAKLNVKLNRIAYEKITLYGDPTKLDTSKRRLQMSSMQHNRPHTTMKNARNLKSVSQAKPPYFEGIFKL